MNILFCSLEEGLAVGVSGAEFARIAKKNTRVSAVINEHRGSPGSRNGEPFIHIALRREKSATVLESLFRQNGWRLVRLENQGSVFENTNLIVFLFTLPHNVSLREDVLLEIRKEHAIVIHNPLCDTKVK